MSDTTSDSSSDMTRGRETFRSSGRGGSGNIRRTSEFSDGSADTDTSVARGREVRAPAKKKSLATGRGGAGNYLSVSLGIPDAATHPHTATIMSQHAEYTNLYEKQVIQTHEETKVIQSSGRGGLGNMLNSRSRSHAPKAKGKGKAKARSSRVPSPSPTTTTSSSASQSVRYSQVSTGESISQSSASGRSTADSYSLVSSPYSHGRYSQTSEGFEEHELEETGLRSPRRDSDGRESVKSKRSLSSLLSRVSLSSSSHKKSGPREGEGRRE